MNLIGQQQHQPLQQQQHGQQYGDNRPLSDDLPLPPPPPSHPPPPAQPPPPPTSRPPAHPPPLAHTNSSPAMPLRSNNNYPPTSQPHGYYSHDSNNHNYVTSQQMHMSQQQHGQGAPQANHVNAPASSGYSSSNQSPANSSSGYSGGSNRPGVQQAPGNYGHSGGFPPPPPPDLAPPLPPGGYKNDNQGNMFSQANLKKTPTNDRSAPRIY